MSPEMTQDNSICHMQALNIFFDNIHIFILTSLCEQ